MNEEIKWQPVALILNKRLECECGALAIFVSGNVSEKDCNVLEKADVWCQDCYVKMQQDEEWRKQE